MTDYRPPFTITDQMIGQISRISQLLGRITSLNEIESRPHLRRNNLIRSIHSSLAIEASSLSLNEVEAVIDGKPVIGPEKEMQEVKNAYLAYEEIGNFDICSLNDLKRLHRIMTDLTVTASGAFRQGEEGVFDGDRCIFMAPPAKRVPDLMNQLFSWMKTVKDELHPLILSSVFHYEFVFIHPFVDGNGRIARLWQTAILTTWDPVFQYIPIESQIHKFQANYYNAISKCHREGSSDSFIGFMLEKIEETLLDISKQSNYRLFAGSEYVKKLLAAMDIDVPYTTKALLELLEMKSRSNLQKNYLKPAMEMGYIVMGLPEKPTSRNQTYTKIKELPL